LAPQFDLQLMKRVRNLASTSTNIDIQKDIMDVVFVPLDHILLSSHRKLEVSPAISLTILNLNIK